MLADPWPQIIDAEVDGADLAKSRRHRPHGLALHGLQHTEECHKASHEVQGTRDDAAMERTADEIPDQLLPHRQSQRDVIETQRIYRETQHSIEGNLFRNDVTNHRQDLIEITSTIHRWLLSFLRTTSLLK